MCHAEYVAGFTRCPDCDADLVGELPEPPRRMAKPRRLPPLPDVSAFETGAGRSNLLARYALLWFLCLLPAAYLVTALVPQLRTADTPFIATGLVPLLVCWAVGASQDRPRHVAARLLIFVGVAAAYALLLWLLLGRGYGDHLLSVWTRYGLLYALAAGFLVQNLLSPNAALRRLVQPLTRWRAPWHVYAVALLAWPLIALLVVELSRHLPATQSGELQSGGSISGMLRLAPLDLLWSLPWALAWFGFAVPLLLHRLSALTTSLVLGVVTGLDLAIPWFVHGGIDTPALCLNIGGGFTLAVVAVWLFQRSRNGVWPVLLLRATTAAWLVLNWDGGGFGGGDNTWIALVAAEAVFAAALVVLGRMWVRPQGILASVDLLDGSGVVPLMR